MRYVPALISLAASSLLFLAGCSSPPPDMTVHGTVQLSVQSFTEISEGSAAYLQIWQGNGQVTVTNPSGTVLEVTTAGGYVKNQPSATGIATIIYGFTAKVPEGLSSYGVSVDGVNETIYFTEAQMRQGPSVCVGDACGG